MRTIQHVTKPKHHKSNSEFVDFDPNIFKKNFASNRNSLPEFLPENDIQIPALCNETTERFNIITKFAFATSVGHQPNNPYKQNQDAYII